MQWRTFAVCALWLLAIPGCAETYRRGGRADRAAHKDAKELLEQDECSLDDYEKYCRGNEDSALCIEKCGE